MNTTTTQPRLNTTWLDDLKEGQTLVSIEKLRIQHQIQHITHHYHLLTVKEIMGYGRIKLSNDVIIDRNGRERGKSSSSPTRVTYHEATPELLGEVSHAHRILHISKLLAEVTSINLTRQSEGTLNSIEDALLRVLLHIRKVDSKVE